ncbi:MAG: trypsin-like serine protease [Proteobacteria bacterium]|nr:MAG: trypsin-like serine protease [Pseudomonadota bacterium]
MVGILKVTETLRCTGILISSDLVITTAHCLVDDSLEL